MKDLSKSHNIKAFSLIEVIVSLAIMAICTLALINFLILSLRITSISLGRSLVREELSNVVNRIAKDFRDADSSPNCTAVGDSCELLIKGTRYKWYSCTNITGICKDRFDETNGIFVNSFSTSDKAKINYFKFEKGFSNNDISGTPNIILTISSAHSNESLGINNIVKQASFSIRNYVL